MTREAGPNPLYPLVTEVGRTYFQFDSPWPFWYFRPVIPRKILFIVRQLAGTGYRLRPILFTFATTLGNYEDHKEM